MLHHPVALQDLVQDLQRAEAVRSAGMSTDADVLSIRVHLAAVTEQQIRTIVTSADKSGSAQSPGGDAASPNLEILVGAAQLNTLNPALLSKMKITISPSDRRWVASEQDGKTVHILAT